MLLIMHAGQNYEQFFFFLANFKEKGEIVK